MKSTVFSEVDVTRVGDPPGTRRYVRLYANGRVIERLVTAPDEYGATCVACGKWIGIGLACHNCDSEE